jgi:hypothetical protein
MKKGLLIAFIIVLGVAGFLTYDWHAKTALQADDQRATLYSWTDAQGAKHYTDTQPPDGAANVETHKGYEYVEPPLVIKIKDQTIEMYGWIKGKLFKKKAKKKKKP